MPNAGGTANAREGEGRAPRTGPACYPPPDEAFAAFPTALLGEDARAVADEDARERLDWLLRMTMSNYSNSRRSVRPGGPGGGPGGGPRPRDPGRPRRGPRRAGVPAAATRPTLAWMLKYGLIRAEGPPPRAPRPPPDTDRTDQSPRDLAAMTEAHLKIECQACRKGLRIRPEFFGQTVTCKGCGHAFVAPAGGPDGPEERPRGRGRGGPPTGPGGGLPEAREEAGAAFRRGEAALGAERPLPAPQGAVPGPPPPLRSPRRAASAGRRALWRRSRGPAPT